MWWQTRKTLDQIKSHNPDTHQTKPDRNYQNQNLLAQSNGVSRIPSGTSLASLASIHEDDRPHFEVYPIPGTDQTFISDASVSRTQSLTTKSSSSSAKEKRRLQCPYCCKIYYVGGHFQNQLRDHREIRPWQQVLLEPHSQQELFQAPSRNMSRNMSQTSFASNGQPSSLQDIPPYPTGSGTPSEQSFWFIDEDNSQQFQDADIHMQLGEDVDEPPFYRTPTLPRRATDDESRPGALFFRQGYD